MDIQNACLTCSLSASDAEAPLFRGEMASSSCSNHEKDVWVVAGHFVQ